MRLQQTLFSWEGGVWSWTRYCHNHWSNWTNLTKPRQLSVYDPSTSIFHVVLSCLYPEVHFPSGCFSMSAIARLAAVANINLHYELAPKHREMIKRLSLPQSLSYNPNPMDTIRVVVEEWLAGKSRLPSSYMGWDNGSPQRSWNEWSGCPHREVFYRKWFVPTTWK